MRMPIGFISPFWCLSHAYYPIHTSHGCDVIFVYHIFGWITIFVKRKKSVIATRNENGIFVVRTIWTLMQQCSCVRSRKYGSDERWSIAYAYIECGQWCTQLSSASDINGRTEENSIRNAMLHCLWQRRCSVQSHLAVGWLLMRQVHTNHVVHTFKWFEEYVCIPWSSNICGGKILDHARKFHTTTTFAIFCGRIARHTAAHIDITIMNNIMIASIHFPNCDTM